uniref:Phospholipase A2 n=1 Tax=Haplochromis burtoni TaxID=8153 RepID=A0A3Q2VCQ5_HAPBU
MTDHMTFAHCIVGMSGNYKALNQFRNMILCVMPDSWPALDYADYGCYCGMGGLWHTQFFFSHPECWPILDNPYTEFYDYNCDDQNKKITCGNNNNECEMFICECDRKAAECFARSSWNPEHEHLPSDQCQ